MVAVVDPAVRSTVHTPPAAVSGVVVAVAFAARPQRGTRTMSASRRRFAMYNCNL